MARDSPRRRAGSAGADSACRQRRRNSIRFWAAQRLALRRFHFAAFHRARDCEGLGFEAGLDHKFKEAPIFYWLYTILIVVGAGVVLLPNAPLWKILIFSQVGNGFGFRWW